MTEPQEPTASGGKNLVVIAAIVTVVLGVGLVVGGLARNRSDSGAGAGEPTSSSLIEDDAAGRPSVGTTAPITPEGGLGDGWAPARDGRAPLRGFGEALVSITSASGARCRVCLLAATSRDQRARGLMEVTDPELGGYDGMVFAYPAPVDGEFYMRNTPMPLSIAFYDAEGAFVSATDMAPCRDTTDCPTYPAGAPFAYAVEVPEGRLADIGATEGSTLQLDAATCPLATGS